jgi:hypothetical protein
MNFLASDVKKRIGAGYITENHQRTGLRAGRNTWKILIEERNPPSFGDIAGSDTAAIFRTSK